MLDTQNLARRRRHKHDSESYWPVAVTTSDRRFHCIILKGRETSPAFPRPLLSEFELEVPITNNTTSTKKQNKKNKTRKDRSGYDDDDGDNDMADDFDDDDNADDENADDDQSETLPLERSLLLLSTLTSLQHDRLRLPRPTSTGKSRRSSTGHSAALTAANVEIDKILLQLLAAECRAGEERGMKAFEIVGLMRDRSGRMLEAAGKVAGRFGRDGLRERIDGLAERRLVGLDCGEDDDDDDGNDDGGGGDGDDW